jgi:type VI secretion system secreted protein VgrG
MKTNLKPEQVIGQPMMVRIDRGEEQPPRFFHGYVCSLGVGGLSNKEGTMAPVRDYRVRLVPWTWFMARAARCFVYLPDKKEKSIQDVLDVVIQRVKSYGHVEPLMESGNAKILKSRKVEHCVQYRETDFNFFSRTLEHYGVFYYFKHTETSHTLVLSDQINYPNAPESNVKFRSVIGDDFLEDQIDSWEHSFEFVSGKWEHSDYDFIHPSTSLKVSAARHPSIPLKNNSAYELYDYPGHYVQKDDGKVAAEIRQDAEETRFDVVTGSSKCRTFSPGYVFKLTEHPTLEDEKGKSYLITSVQHVASQPGPFSTSGDNFGYSNSFTCIPREGQYRPPRVTPRPVLSSVQTAVVVGPSGEEIYTDEYGRIKVQFHWDREGKKNENTSCWIRVAQNWAGAGWGLMQIPHVGHEVVVAFLEGDPDQPLVVGRVYNAEQKVPMPLPAEKTRSVLRDYGGNETVMEGAKGKQFIHTQQTCGNEFIMDGSTGNEKIALKDKYGNQIVLDAVEKIIHIYCPTHESEIVLGRSVQIRSLSDLVHEIKGMEWTVISGPKHENIAGISSKLIGGLKHETVIGAEAKLNLLSKNELMIGLCIKIAKALQYEKKPTDITKAEQRKELYDKASAFIKGQYDTTAETVKIGAKLYQLEAESAIKCLGKEIAWEATKLQVCAKMTIEGAKTIGKSLLDWGNGLFKVKASSSKSPKAPAKRKASKSEKMSEAKRLKAIRQAQKAARRMNRLRS